MRVQASMAYVLSLIFGPLLLTVPNPAAAQSPESFYAGRQMQLIVAGGAGGGVDVFGRLVARHFLKHLPGNPSLVAQNMPAAGGVVGVNQVYNQAPRDGSVIATMARGPLLEPLIGARAVHFDPTKFGWLGSVSKDVSICAAWHTAPFKTIDDARQREMIVAGTGGTSETDTFPMVVNELLGTKFKLIRGYSGTQATLLAIENGEVHGRCGWGWSSLKTTNPDWIRDKKLNVLLQMSLERHLDLRDVPTIMDLVSDADNQAVLRLILGTQIMARPFFTTPDVPSDRLAALRRAFDLTMTDKDFIAEAERLQIDIEPTSGAQVASNLEQIYASPKPIVERAKAMINP